MKRIEITIAPDGQSQVATTGFAGDSCRQASRFLEQALGRSTAEQLTADFHQAQLVEQQETERL